MARPLELLTMAVTSLLILQGSSATHPFYQAFSPLREAFGERLFDLKPSPDAGALYTSQSAEATSPLGVLFREEYDKTDLRPNSEAVNSAGIQLETSSSIGAQQEPLSRIRAQQETSSRIGDQQEPLSRVKVQQETLSRIGTQQETLSRIRAQQETSSRIGAQQEPLSRIRAQQEPSSRIGAQPGALSRIRAQQETSSRIGAQPEILGRIGSQQETLSRTGAQPEALSRIGAQQETLSRIGAQQETSNRMGAQQGTLIRIRAQPETLSRIGAQPETLSRTGVQQEISSKIGAQQESLISAGAHHGSSSLTGHQQGSSSLNLGKSAFNLDTFTFNRNNTRRRDDIFSALADVEVDLPEELETAEDEHMRINTISENRIPSKSQEGEDHGTANDFTKKILYVVKNVENVLSTMSFMKNLYHTKKASMAMLSPPSSSSPSLSTPSVTSSILDVLLDVPLLESLRTVGLTARTERDFLDHMASVLVGAESRSSTLTLDPVTVIALLTLAAYLIRAVYEIITVTGRSLDGDLGSLAFSDFPETITKIHNWISTINVNVAGEGKVTRDVKDNLDVPGDLAAVLKLHRQGNNPCVKEFLCQSLQYRPLKVLKLSDMMIGWISYYYGDPTVSQLIDSALEDNDTCNGSTRHTCSPGTLIEISQLRSIFSSLTEKLLGLVDTYQNAL